MPLRRRLHRTRHISDRSTLERHAAESDFSRASSANDSAETTNDRKEEGKNPAAVPAGAANAAAGKTYVLFEGTILETVLINRLDGQFSGPVECLLSTDVYSNDRQHLLIPAGSKLARRNQEGGHLRPDTSGRRLSSLAHA